jgi:uncharacterized RDD family membrane protein YckC
VSDASISRSGPRAGIGVRFVAALIDGVLTGIVTVLLAVALKGTGSAVGILVSIVYFAYFEGQPAGQTLGKKAMNIRVIDFGTGGSLETSKAIVRSVVRYISGLVCAIGFIWALFNDQKQTWHDLAATTVVVPVADYPVPA